MVSYWLKSWFYQVKNDKPHHHHEGIVVGMNARAKGVLSLFKCFSFSLGNSSWEVTETLLSLIPLE